MYRTGKINKTVILDQSGHQVAQTFKTSNQSAEDNAEMIVEKLNIKGIDVLVRYKSSALQPMNVLLAIYALFFFCVLICFNEHEWIVTWAGLCWALMGMLYGIVYFFFYKNNPDLLRSHKEPIPLEEIDDFIYKFKE